MTANEIHLKVRGTFVDGISTNATRALNTVSSLSSKVGRACNGMTQAMSAFGGAASSSLGKVASGVGNLVGAFATMGPVGGIVAGISLAFETWSKRATEAAEKCKKFADELKAAIDAKFNAELAKMNDSLKDTASEADRAAKAVENMAKAYLTLSAAQDATVKAENNNDLAILRNQKQVAMGAAGSDGEKARVGAAYDTQIAQTRLAQIVQEQAAKIETAVYEETTAQKKLKIAIEKEEEWRLAVAKAEEEQAEMSGVDAKLDKALAEKVRKANEAYEKAVEEHEKAEDAAEVATEKVKTARLEQAAAITDARTAVIAATQTEEKLSKSLKEAQEKRIKAEEAAALAATKKDLQEQLKEAENRGKEAAGAVNAANAEVAAAQQKFNSNINANLANARINQQMSARQAQGSGFVRSATTSAEAKAEQAAAAQVAVNQGIANGTIRNTTQMQNAAKAAARANRDYNSSKEANQEKRDAAEYERLSNMSEKAMSQWQKNRLGQLQKLKDAKDKDANDLAAAEQKKQQLEQAQIDAAKDVKEIKEKLEELGLK